MKIVVAGPKGCGKSILCDFLVGDNQTLNRATAGSTLPEPTKGVRIRECERDLGTGGSSKTAIELWDCSGDQNFEQCWPAILVGAHGVILVYNPEKPIQEQEISLWYDYFVKAAGLDDDQCLLLVHKSSGGSQAARLAPPPKLSRVGVVNTSYDAGDLVRGKFEAFLHSLVYKKPSQPGGGGEVPSEANEAEQQAKAMH